MWVDDSILVTGGDWRFAVRANRIAIGLASYELCKKLDRLSSRRKGGAVPLQYLICLPVLSQRVIQSSCRYVHN